MKKKALSVLLALVMLLALVPAAVFAAQSAPEAEEEQVMIPFAKERDVEEDTQLP